MTEYFVKVNFDAPIYDGPMGELSIAVQAASREEAQEKAQAWLYGCKAHFTVKAVETFEKDRKAFDEAHPS